MEIIKVKNYKVFADTLKNKTGCEVDIRVLNKDHTHYQLSKDGISLGILCVDRGEVSFAPFVTHGTAKNEQYIDVQYLPMLDDLIRVLNVFRELFVSEEAIERKTVWEMKG